MFDLRTANFFIDVSSDGSASGMPFYNVTYEHVTDTERNFDHEWWAVWSSKYWLISGIFATIYVIVIHGLKKWMKDRPRYDLRNFLFFWNVSLALFSMIGSIRTWTEFMYVMNNFGFHSSVCMAGLR